MLSPGVMCQIIPEGYHFGLHGGVREADKVTEIGPKELSWDFIHENMRLCMEADILLHLKYHNDSCRGKYLRLQGHSIQFWGVPDKDPI